MDNCRREQIQCDSSSNVIGIFEASSMPMDQYSLYTDMVPAFGPMFIMDTSSGPSSSSYQAIQQGIPDASGQEILIDLLRHTTMIFDSFVLSPQWDTNSQPPPDFKWDLDVAQTPATDCATTI
ncbi:hypothetical protein AC578_9813 [Pseudocercospora eumusae]|uniref:Uncharacterized protein n=1 Tax=Pseudocercospora eumusae TaxID=321146 RepID=A0A139H9M0_9PEZI|nr:hypothetical protein AC578_9813 [Pseudocercospora eumusae]